MKSKIVMAQIGSSNDKHEKLKKAEECISNAIANYGAEMILFPEAFMSYFEVGTSLETKRDDAEFIDGPFVNSMINLANKYGIWIVFNMREATTNPKDKRVFNTTVILNNKGENKGLYRKTHLYDAFGAKESEGAKPGNSLFEPIDTPFGKIGLFVCYELRFPEVARYQAIHGADIILIPSGWVKGPLKEHHWKNLVISRALENNLYVIACNHVNDYYIGQSLAVDPMGVVISQGGEEERLIPCNINLDRVKNVRNILPSYKHRRTELYSN